MLHYLFLAKTKEETCKVSNASNLCGHNEN